MDARKKELPSRPNLEQYKKQAKDLVRAFKSADSDTLQRVEKSHPHAENLLSPNILKAKFALADAQLIVAREHGFDSWPKFAKRIETLKRESSAASASDELEEFIEAASVPLDAHSTGTLERAEAILAAHPEIAAFDIYSAATLGDDAAVRRWLALDPQNATAKGGLRDWDALTYLCFSRYLRLDRTRSAGFVRAATALLDAGASASTGYFEPAHQPEPEFESALYGAAGVARHVELTRLLLTRGADANNGEVVYHAPESYDNSVVKVLVESGRLTQDSLATMLLRKHDWHDYEGIKWLLEHGADPNRMTHWHRTALHQAVTRDNSLEIFEVALDHGADPTLVAEGKSVIAIAARKGRGDLLELFERRGIAVDLRGKDQLLAACARGDAEAVRSTVPHEPGVVKEVLADGGKLLAEFSGNGNTEGVRRLLDLGVDVASQFSDGDNYWDVAKNSTALHVAAWRARHSTVKLLIERRAPVDALDNKGRTPLALAVRACVDSYWKDRRSPESVEALLVAGASVSGVDFPSGYAGVDELLRCHANKMGS
ncbi:MAG TPA: ankyrin repeat domain-containing protein [Candidatus Sulfotelmatobacter sp.]